MKINKIKEQQGLIFSYINYQIRARHRNGHGIHSPYLFEFFSRVLFDKTSYPEYKILELIRNNLRHTHEKLTVHNTGAGSRRFSRQERKVSELLKISSVNRTFGKLLFRIARYYKPSVILELGTSIGMSTLYLATGSPASRLITIDAEYSLCDFARRLFKNNTVENITVFEGLFDERLKELEQDSVPELVFIDGDHSYEATMKYFNYFSSRMKKGFLVFDDINWSAGMSKAWKEIVRDNKAPVTIDLFYMGIVLFRDSITPGHFIARF